MFAATMLEYGPASVLVPAEIAAPDTQPARVRVSLRAAALNWHDVLVRQGRYRSPLPHVPGADGAGVDEDGNEVIILPSLWWGSSEAVSGAEWEILGDRMPGTYAEVVSVPRESLFPRPKGFSWEEAAALPRAGVTAFRALVSRGRLRAGEYVLILGASGGVATASVLIASTLGPRAVVTSSLAERIEQAVSLGAAGGELYVTPDWPERAKERTPASRGFDLVVDSVGSWESSLRALRPGGRLVVLVRPRSGRRCAPGA